MRDWSVSRNGKVCQWERTVSVGKVRVIRIRSFLACRFAAEAASHKGCEYRAVLVENRLQCLHFVNAVDPVFQLLPVGAVQPGFDLRRHFTEAAP
ncbi:hypothetical protein GCM10007426_29250 [Alloalcanivorax dieselolei]|nr:hypothetical protein GCM10007426_29250 [Alloalcanivorax dieselolei]